MTASPHARFQDGCRSGRLDFPWDPVAGRPVWYPRLVAPGTGTAELQWRTSEGLGTVHSTTWIHARDASPRNVSLVDVDEGFRMMSRVDAPAEQVRIGLRVRVTFVEQDGEDAPVPVFVPLESA